MIRFMKTLSKKRTLFCTIPFDFISFTLGIKKLDNDDIFFNTSPVIKSSKPVILDESADFELFPDHE